MTRFLRVNRTEDIQDDLGAALAVVEALDPPDDLRLAVFQFAAQLVTQRVMEQSPSGLAVPAMQVPRSRGH